MELTGTTTKTAQADHQPKFFIKIICAAFPACLAAVSLTAAAKTATTTHATKKLEYASQLAY